jgi:hypothetical protein
MAMNHVAPDWKAIRKQNKFNLDATADGKSIPYLAVGNILLVGTGDGHASVKKFCLDAPNQLYGIIRIDKATNHGIVDRGKLTVSSWGKGEREIAAELRQVSNKNIVFELVKPIR